MDFPMDPKDPGRWEVDDDPATDPDQRSALTGQTRPPREGMDSADEFGARETLEGSGEPDRARPVSDADFGAHSGEPSGTGEDFTTSDPAMVDQPVEGGEAEAEE